MNIEFHKIRKNESRKQEKSMLRVSGAEKQPKNGVFDLENPAGTITTLFLRLKIQ